MNSYSITISILTFIFGISIGSFLNVLIYRFGSGTRLTGRSKCLACGKTLSPLMLIPLFSFIFLRGRCAHCSAKLSIQYPFVEAVTGALFVLIAVKNGLLLPEYYPPHLVISLLEAVIWSLLVVVFIYDWKHKIIPDTFAVLFAVFSGILLFTRTGYGFIQLPYLPFLNSTPVWIDWAAAPIVAFPLALVWLLTLGRGMGLGDAKLAWGIGWFLGFSGAVSAVILSFWIAFIPSLVLLFWRSKRFTMKSEIPFAPFLVLGTLVAYAFEVNILSWTF